MSELDPVLPSGEAIVEPVVVTTPKKSRAGMFFIGAFSGCAVVFAGMLLLGVLIASMANDDEENAGEDDRASGERAEEECRDA